LTDVFRGRINPHFLPYETSFPYEISEVDRVRIPQSGGRSKVRRKLVLVALVLFLAQTNTYARASTWPYRGFTANSYWNTPLPRGAPIARNSGKIIAYLKQTNDRNHVRLSGLSKTGAWGMPIYWGHRGDPLYDIASKCSWRQPPELNRVRIPIGARPDPTADAAMVVYNRRAGKVFHLWRASHSLRKPHWRACGSVYYLRSNGLAGDVAGSNEPRNRGHLGIPPTITAIRLAEVRARAIRHVLWMHVHHVKCGYVWPMDGTQCSTTAANAPPDGTRIRIKPWVDLTTFHLSRAELTVARALKRYGAIIGDQSGGSVIIKAENTVAERRGFKWKGVLDTDSLWRIGLRYFQVIKLGWRP
jgi:hypothetical protein